MLTLPPSPRTPAPATLARLERTLRALWRADRPLTATGLLMCVGLAATVVGLFLDPRSITGAPAWLKPAKFAASTAIYSFTLAWVFSLLPEWTRTRAVVGWTTATVFVLEVAIIAVQAWRGTTSHFNVGTPLDATLFSIMGTAIFAQTAASVAVAVALWRQTLPDAAVAKALRAGMIITILGAASGGLMTRPTGAQLDNLRTTGRLPIAGSHTVGAPDGGPGVPGVGWSRSHGDLRVGHFVGLHAIQVLPIVALLLARRRSADVAARLVTIVVTSYAALFGLLVAQALRGESIANPGLLSTALFASLGAGMLAALWNAHRHSVPVRRTAALEV